MTSYSIIEIDDGFEIIEVLAGQSAEDAAIAAGGVLVDPGPYDHYDDAIDALSQLEIMDDER